MNCPSSGASGARTPQDRGPLLGSGRQQVQDEPDQRAAEAQVVLERAVDPLVAAEVHLGRQRHQDQVEFKVGEGVAGP